jgi:hypothetical protein
MGAAWAKIAGTGLVLLAFGCRTPQPNLKPPATPEALNTPPQERRFNASDYPKEAFNDRNPLRKLDVDQPVVPVRGPGMPGQPGMMPR